MLKKAISRGAVSKLPSQCQNLAQMLPYVAAAFPHKGLIFVNGKGLEERLKYSELLQLAKQKLKALQAQGIQSRDKLILVIDNSKEFYIAYWACLLGGIIPAPVSQPSSWDAEGEGIQKLIRIWQVLNYPYILIEAKNCEDCETLRANERYNNFKYLVTQELLNEQEGCLDGLNSELNELVFLQFSSGSTGTPKGVSLTNRNILTNVYALKERLKVTEQDTSFTWVPHTHDMGLFVQHLTPLYSGSTIVIFSAATFVQSPYLFLKKFAEHQGTWFCSTNFGFDWMTRVIKECQLGDLDFSQMRFALNGAEPISAPVTQRFIDKFAVCGFKETMMLPAYGMAEATVGVSIPEIGSCLTIHQLSRQQLVNHQKAIPPQTGESIAEFFAEGKPIRGVKVRIADDNGVTLNEREIGEIQLQGDSVTAGYYNNPEINQELFADGWLRTGDLGYLADGQVIVTGRKKDIIIIRGQNYYAHDLEEVVYRKGLLPRGNVVFAGVFQHQEQREEIIVFIKNRMKQEQLTALCADLHKLIRAEIGLHIDAIILVKAIPKTTSGKVQRYALKQSYENGEFTEIFHYPQAEPAKATSQSHLNGSELEHFIYESWMEILSLEPDSFTVDDHFQSLGGNSVKMYLFLAQLQNYLGIEIGAEIFKRNHTIRAICQYLEAQQLVKAAKTQTVNEAEKTTAPLVAITGLALRLPDANDQETFWENLSNGLDSIAVVSEKRKQLADDPEWQDILGEWLDIDYFDHPFFDIPLAEAVFMDPQHRLILEMAQETLEDAGVLADNNDEQAVGVYVGANNNVYFHKILKYIEKNGIDNVPANTLVRNLQNIIAASITHQYDFTGPALAIDTACSSFLVSLHYAAQAIRRNEITGAVVASSNIMESRSVHTLARNAGILTAGTKSKVFDATADGSLLGEGAVVVYLEPLTEETIRNKHVYGLLRGSAVNNDGFSYGIMAPNPKGQYQVLKAAYQDAQLSPREISYVEAHGTGTTIGDPIEINAWKKLFAEQSGEHDELEINIGSVKPNIGHLLPAAGGAGLAKVLLSIKHQQIPPSLYVDNINPALELEKSPFRIATSLQPWQTDGSSRKAGITSLGLGGTNCHVIIEEWQPPVSSGNQRQYELITLSAKTAVALQRLEKQMLTYLNNCDAKQYEDVAFTRNRYREHYDNRSVFILDKTTGVLVKGESDGKRRTLAETSELLSSLNELVNLPSSAEQKIREKKMMETLAKAYLTGSKIDWKLLHPDGSARIMPLPAYPFEKISVWLSEQENEK